MNRTPKASDVLADQLRSKILSHGLPPNTALPSESEIIEQYGYSRGTVREALRLLEVAGLIVIKRGPNGGIRVREPDISQVSRSLAVLFTSAETPLGDLFRFRKLVEPAAAGYAAKSATDDERDRLRSYVDGEARGEDLGSATDFHQVVGELTHNGPIEVVLSALHDVLEWHVREERLSRENLLETAEVHASIAKAIIDGDSHAAERRMLGHVESFEKVLEEQGRLTEPIVPRDRWLV